MPLRVFITVLSLVLLLTLSCSCRPSHTPSRGDQVLADVAFFGPEIAPIVKEARAYLDKELKQSADDNRPVADAATASADLSLTADFPLPTLKGPIFAKIKDKYGAPDRTVSKSTQESTMTIHYYGDIGLGVSGPAETGAVTRIFVHRTITLKN